MKNTGATWKKTGSHELSARYLGAKSSRTFDLSKVFKHYPREHVRIVSMKTVDAKVWRIE